MMKPSLRELLGKVRDLMGRGGDRTEFTGLHGVDRKLAAIAGHERGFFVEAGANDGITQSNTFFLEKRRQWRGLLVEADPRLCAKCRRARPASATVQAGLVGPDYRGSTVELYEAGLMSFVAGSLTSAAQERQLSAARRFAQKVTGKTITVPARTLGQVLEAAGAPQEFDLLSLDVEGHEPTVLKGVDLDRWRPRLICVESRDQEALESALDSRYRLIAVLHQEEAYSDLLYERL